MRTKQKQPIFTTQFQKMLTAFALALVMMAGALLLPVQDTAMAATAHMKTVPVMWDLKNNKTVTFRTRVIGLGMVKAKAKVTNWKIKDASKKGYKQLTFKVTYDIQAIMSGSKAEKEKKVQKIIDYISTDYVPSIGADYWYSVVDYQTGKCLQSGINKKVTCKEEVKDKKIKKFWTADRKFWVSFTNKSLTCKVIYPKTYKNLCIGVGGSISNSEVSIDKKFWKGKAAFGKTTKCSKEYKDVAHFIRVK